MSFLKRIPPLLLSLSLSPTIFAGAFQLWEENGSDTGDYHAGAAAEANDASDIFYNPAGMSRIKNQQISVGAAFINLDLGYNGTTYIHGSSDPLGTTTSTVQGGTFNVVPNFHYVLPINDRWAVGFEETTPFGLSTNYHDPDPDVDYVDWIATKTELKTFNLNPSISYAFNDHVSLGAGFDAMYGQATYDNVAILEPLDNQLSGWGYGYNAGLLVQFSPTTRLGLSYRSAITIAARGNSQFGTNDEATQSTVSANFPLPATTMMSLYHDVTDRLALMASAFYTQWSCFNELVIHNMAQSVGSPPATVGLFENYKNTWNYALGTIYKLNSRVSAEAGFGHDQTPTRIPYRDIRLPDDDRYAASVGLNIHVTPKSVWSIGWTHFFSGGAASVDSSGSLDTEQTSSSIADLFAYGKGSVNSSVNVFGLQMTWDL